MAFAFNSSAGKQSVKDGGELPEIVAEGLGFSGIGRDKKLKLLPAPWPADNLPSSSASLLSVASKRRLLVAASPDALIVASTDAVRKAYAGEADDDNVISSFQPGVTVPVPKLRHVTFSSDEDFLITSTENDGGLAVYSSQDLLQGNEPEKRISTDQIPLRALQPNPKLGHYFAAVLDSGSLIIADVVEGQSSVLHHEGVTCMCWSLGGKAVVAGLQDGTAVQYSTDGTLMATIPHPPEVDRKYAVSAIYWLQLNEFLVIHSSPKSAEDVEQESAYHIVESNKDRTEFTFRKTPYDILFESMGPKRDRPLRYSVSRLRNWKPELDDLLILVASNSADVATLTSTSAPIASEQETLKAFTLTTLGQENRKATLPQIVNEEEGGDSVLIGDTLDLSSEDKILQPIPMDDEFTQSSTPVPAFLVLNHQGLLSAWWIVYDNSIRAGTAYPGLAIKHGAQSTPLAARTQLSSKPSATPSNQSNSVFGQPQATFGTPSTSIFGSSKFDQSPRPQAAASFGKPSQPGFGTPSAIGSSGGMGFGTTGPLGNRSSPWASTSKISAPQTASNPFSAAAGSSSGFAKFGGNNTSTSGSSFSSFGSVAGAQSPFSSLSQNKSVFSGISNESTAFKGADAGPSFGSTVTLTSREGSTLPPSWTNTPVQQSGPIFGTNTSSFTSTRESDMSDADDADNRQRDEATPTPQAPPQAKDVFGLGTNDFKLTSSFKGDSSASDHMPKTQNEPNDLSFGSGFSSALGGISSKPPATPIKNEEDEPRLQDIPTTPAFPDKPSSGNLFSSSTPASAIPMKKPPVDDAPLPPDFVAAKPSKNADSDIPPLAGSPAIKVEASESDVPLSALDDSGDDISVAEQDGDDEEEEEDDENDDEDEEPSPSDAVRRARPQKPGWVLQDSVNQSPRIFPAAPTPPAVKSGTPSYTGVQSRGTSRSPIRQGLFGSTKPQPAMFGPSGTPAGFPKPSTIFPSTSSRAQENLRSPSPVRAASTSAIGARRPQIFPQGTHLSSSIQQQPKPPTPQPEVSDLSDDEDERIRGELASDRVPSRTLDAFIAHQDYTGAVTKTGTAAQIEIMYRDMNSMVDTVGLNARSLASFILFHADRSPLTHDHLEDIIDQGEDGHWFDKWCVSGIEDLRTLENELEQELDEGRIRNTLDKLSQLARLLQENARLLTKINDIRRQIINRKDPDKIEALRKASLPKELADQQKALRGEYARLLSLLSQAEEAAYLLKSKVSSSSAANGRTAAVPTVDAVKKTINRLIQMTERKNNDILLLESQLRKLNPGGSRPSSSSSRHLGTPSRSTRSLRTGQSPLTTPPTNRSQLSLSQLNRTVQTPEPDETPSKGYGLFYTPEGSPMEGSSQSLVKLVDDLEGDALDSLRATARRRREAANRLTEVILSRGVRVTKVN